MTNDKTEGWLILIIALLISGIELYALSKGINGTCLGASIVVLGGLGGYKLRSILKKV